MAKNTVKRGKYGSARRAIAGLASAVFITLTVSGGYMKLVGRVGFILCLDVESEPRLDLHFICEQSELWQVFGSVKDVFEGDGS